MHGRKVGWQKEVKEYHYKEDGSYVIFSSPIKDKENQYTEEDFEPPSAIDEMFTAGLSKLWEVTGNTLLYFLALKLPHNDHEKHQHVIHEGEELHLQLKPKRFGAG